MRAFVYINEAGGNYSAVEAAWISIINKPTGCWDSFGKEKVLKIVPTVGNNLYIKLKDTAEEAKVLVRIEEAVKTGYCSLLDIDGAKTSIDW